MYALVAATRYIVERDVPGDIVECGVWRGGSAMICALTLLSLGVDSRRIHLFDTFSGMTAPTSKDRDVTGSSPVDRWAREEREDHNAWCYAPLDEVIANLRSTGYPEQNLRFIKGRVEETLPAPELGSISLLRLDTDWYESTYHELKHLFPLVENGGVAIFDDYGYWQGAREAVDTYFDEEDITLLMNRVDGSGRLVIKS
ncbi:MAG: TylF/MycF family methyltransferase [Actinomycetota bacterium]|nr:TylF/MycF family methyltransferase [Actinomycetota bacterium]